jgi:hypothetical protein
MVVQVVEQVGAQPRYLELELLVKEMTVALVLEPALVVVWAVAAAVQVQLVKIHHHLVVEMVAMGQPLAFQVHQLLTQAVVAVVVIQVVTKALVEQAVEEAHSAVLHLPILAAAVAVQRTAAQQVAQVGQVL